MEQKLVIWFHGRKNPIKLDWQCPFYFIMVEICFIAPQFHLKIEM